MSTIIENRYCGECDEVMQHSVIVSNPPVSVHTILDCLLEDWTCLDCRNSYREVQLYPENERNE